MKRLYKWWLLKRQATLERMQRNLMLKGYVAEAYEIYLDLGIIDYKLERLENGNTNSNSK